MNLANYLTPGWIGLTITLIGFITYYLGRIVLDFYPSKEDRALNYILGFILFLIYILIPVLLFYYFPKLILDLTWITFFIFWIFFGLLAKYFDIKMNVFQIIRGRADKLFYDVSSKNISKFGFNLQDKPKLNKLFKNLFLKLPDQLKVILLGYLTIFLVVNIFFFFDNWIIRIFIIIATISTFNKIIILHNVKGIKYDEVIIKDMQNKQFRGRLIKQDADYIVLYCNQKERYVFPRENIKNIKYTVHINTKKDEIKINHMAKLWRNLTK